MACEIMGQNVTCVEIIRLYSLGPVVVGGAVGGGVVGASVGGGVVGASVGGAVGKTGTVGFIQG